MPRLEGYEQQVGQVGAVEFRRMSGEDLSIGAGLKGLSEGISAVGDAMQKNQEQKEVSSGNAAMADFRAKKSVEWNETLSKADPDDPDVAKKFLAQYDDDYEKVRERVKPFTARGNQHLDDTSAQMKAQFFESTMAGQAELAKVKAKQDYVTTENSLSSAAENDPASHASIMAQFGRSVDELVTAKKLPTETALQLKTQGHSKITKSAVKGMIELDPEHAQAMLKSGQYDSYLDGEEKHQLYSQADQAIRARQVEIDRHTKAAEKIIKEQQEETQNVFLEKLSKGTLTTKDILRSNLEAFGSGSKEQFMGMVHKASTQRMETNPNVYQDLFNRIHADDSDPRKIWDANDLNSYFGRGLNMDGLGNLRKELDGSRTPEGKIEAQMRNGLLKIAKGKLTKSNPMTGFADPEGDTQLQRYTMWLTKEYTDQRKLGKTPRELLDPDSKDYLGKAIGQFARSNDQIMQDLIRQSTGGAPADGGLAGAPPAPAEKQDPQIAGYAKKYNLDYSKAEKILKKRGHGGGK